VAHAVLREAAVGGGEHGRAVGTLALDRHLHGAQVAHDVRARVDGEDAGRRQHGRGVDGGDARVGVRGAHDDGPRLPGQAHVTEEASLPAQQPGVLDALDTLPDPEAAHQHVLMEGAFSPCARVAVKERP
jgi:hypothetical protein